MGEQDGCGLLWLASPKLEKLKQSGNSLWGTFPSLGLYGQGTLPTCSPLRILHRRGVAAQKDTFVTPTVTREGHSAGLRGSITSAWFGSTLPQGCGFRNSCPKALCDESNPLGANCLMLIVLPRLWRQHEPCLLESTSEDTYDRFKLPSHKNNNKKCTVGFNCLGKMSLHLFEF